MEYRLVAKVDNEHEIDLDMGVEGRKDLAERYLARDQWPPR